MIGLMSFYDEDPDMLRDTITSLAGVIETLIVVDGPYALFPNAEPRSPGVQHVAIREAAATAGIYVEVHSRRKAWATEMEKRSFLFQCADRYDTSHYLVVDADSPVLAVPTDLEEQLKAPVDVWTTTMVEPHRQAETETITIPNVFRAIRGIRVVRNHFTYMTPDGRKLWGRGRQVERRHLHDLVFEHRTNMRAPERRERAKAYYKQRDTLAIEAGTCERCDKPAEHEIPYDWVPTDKGLSSDWISVCDRCLPMVREDNRQVLLKHGLDPETAQVSFIRS